MDLNEFSRANAARCTSGIGFGHAPGDWSLSDWMVATLGELGEAANVLKKLNRYRDGIAGNTASKAELIEQFEREIADTMIYLDLLAQAAGFSLADAVRKTWNAKSKQIGYPGRI